ncbi:MAG TPA: 2Fe-2S iron-sulfur cluster-binding protein, partial [Candidatus Methanomethylicus sp.]|nr:2Fe-2S iron-sulfur cluster-binding protein [Candidatus Methanomethylicus sp.]
MPEGKRVAVPDGTTLMAAAINGEVDIATICGGKGFCGKCLVEVIEGELSTITDLELKRIPPEKVKKGYRFACQAQVKGNVTVRVPDQSRVGRQRLVIMGKEPPIKIRSNVEKVYLEIDPPTLHDTVADDIRLYAALGSRGILNARLDYRIGTKITEML